MTILIVIALVGVIVWCDSMRIVIVIVIRKA